MLLNHPRLDSDHHTKTRMPTILCRKESKPIVVVKDQHENRRDPRDYCERNLLEKNLCVKLSKSYRERTLRSGSCRTAESKGEKEIFHLTNSGEETNTTRHRHAKRQKSTEPELVVNARQRLISWAADAEAYLPEIQQSEGHPEASVQREVEEDGPEIMTIPNVPKPKENTFPKLDAVGMQWIASSSIRMMKLNGVFQPVNKYERPRWNHSASEMPMTNLIHEYETLMLPVKEKTVPKSNADPRQKIGTRVSWTGNISRQPTDVSRKSQNREKSDVSENSQNRKRADSLDQRSKDVCKTTPDRSKPEYTSGKNTSLSNRTRSVTHTSFVDKADSLCCPFKKPTYHAGKTKVETVGVKWAIPRRDHASGGVKRLLTRSAPLSRCTISDLHPVTTAMNREGTSLEKIRGKVMTSSCSYNTHEFWLETLKSLKSPSFGLESHLRGVMIDTARDNYVPAFDSLYVMVGESSPSL